MQYAAEIRDAFFSNGATASFDFLVTPEALDPSAEVIVLEIGDQVVQFGHNSLPQQTAIEWSRTTTVARLTFRPTLSKGMSTVSYPGPWGLFRLLDAAELRRTNAADRSRAIFSVGGRLAIFEIQAEGVQSPFSLTALSEFQCPRSL
ncbi:MAG: type VI secretion IcmF C-terminal domain-containing protein, partial [Pseudomonadota bacterium]